jgi:hypothetical protein
MGSNSLAVQANSLVTQTNNLVVQANSLAISTNSLAIQSKSRAIQAHSLAIKTNSLATEIDEQILTRTTTSKPTMTQIEPSITTAWYREPTRRYGEWIREQRDEIGQRRGQSCRSRRFG